MASSSTSDEQAQSSPVRGRLSSCGSCSPIKRISRVIPRTVEMATGTACFRRELPFHTMIQGSINGQPFIVEGKGLGDSSVGKVRGKWTCNSGKMPMSWAALASTLGYGMKCFALFPNGLLHFFQECMPEGYTQERVTRFQDDGTLKTYHEIHFQKGVIMNKITLQGEGFKADSPVLTYGIKCQLPVEERTFPYEDGVKSLGHIVYPLKSGDGFLVATQTTVNRPLGENRTVAIPAPYFTRSHVMQFKDTDDDSDHIISDEVLEAYHLSLFGLPHEHWHTGINERQGRN